MASIEWLISQTVWAPQKRNAQIAALASAIAERLEGRTVSEVKQLKQDLARCSSTRLRNSGKPRAFIVDYRSRMGRKGTLSFTAGAALPAQSIYNLRPAPTYVVPRRFHFPLWDLTAIPQCYFFAFL